jgi:dTDP-4-amino-4,6-dideoxygalactose transaminase
MSKPLFVASPILPDLEDLKPYLESIWDRRILTNGGIFHGELEKELSRYLGVPTAMLFNNGTIGLMAALRMFNLPLGSEVITTPLTFAATAHAISWNGLVPVFADICPDDLTLDPASVELAITEKTSAILAVHVYGSVCNLDALEGISKRHGLRLIYDAAHAFGTTVYGRPIGTFGDASIFSFHATKLFHTFEGGMITTNRAEDRETISYLRNFGIKNEEEVIGIGLNGKMNELQAVIGLLTLPLVEAEKKSRLALRQKYENFLGQLPGIRLLPAQPGVCNSEQYFPIQIDSNIFGRTRDDLYNGLKERDIFSRKYFHPICTDFEPYRGFPIHTARPLPYVQEVKSTVLCLPFHSGVDDSDVDEMRDEFLMGF